jgi:hypothetical protein
MIFFNDFSAHDREEYPSRATGLIISISQRIETPQNVRYHSSSWTTHRTRIDLGEAINLSFFATGNTSGYVTVSAPPESCFICQKQGHAAY